MSKQPKWISHRGNRVKFDENTVEAFESATANGYRHLETDLRISSDNHVLHWHDPLLLDREGKTIILRDHSRSELENIRLARGGRLMFFDEFRSRFSKFDWTLDIKAESGSEVLFALKKFDEISNWSAERRDLRFLIWSPQQREAAEKIQMPLQRYADKAECIRAGLFVAAGLSNFGRIDKALVYSLPSAFLGISLFKPSIVDAFHQRNARVIAFLPSTIEQVKLVKEAGFDEILSDFPSPI